MHRSFTDWGGNILALVLVITVNGLANAIPIGGQTTGEVSARYPSLFTPAGYAFSIWGLIYLGLIVYVIYQALPAQRNNAALAGISRMFVLSCAANAAWIMAWHYNYLLLSLLLMGVILFSLARIYSSLGIVNTTVSRTDRWFVHLPISLYFGWITVATIANISAVQTGMGWDAIGISPINWTLVKLAIAGTIAATITLRRGDLVFGLVVAWAATAISVKQAATPAVAGAASTLALVAVLLVAFEAIRRQRR